MSTNLNPALPEALVDTIAELQALPSLRSFALAGGTNLAFRFGHRRSIDIDLFSNETVGLAGLEQIREELQTYYGGGVIYCQIEDPGAGDQYCFLRAFVKKREDFSVKIEIIQNIALMDAFEEIDGIRLLTKRDIGLLKLISASNRKAKKDIYDLDHITDDIALADLMAMLAEKQQGFSGNEFRSLFDLDGEQSPTNDLNLLLAFDQIEYTDLPNRPNHLNDSLDIVSPNKEWREARRSWRSKVVAYMRTQGMQPPSARPIN